MRTNKQRIRQTKIVNTVLRVPKFILLRIYDLDELLAWGFSFFFNLTVSTHNKQTQKSTISKISTPFLAQRKCAYFENRRIGGSRVGIIWNRALNFLHESLTKLESN